MEAPGEKLILKLWDSVEKLTIGLLKPTQMKRLAKVESEIALQKLLDDEKYNRVSSDLALTNQIESISSKDDCLTEAVLNQRHREEMNALKSIYFAHENLSDEKASDNESSEDIEPDWIHRWYSYASKVSTEDIQLLWGKILSGEIKNPNTMSYRLMDFIDKLTVLEIEQISLILSLADKRNNIIIRGVDKSIEFFESNGITSEIIQKYSDLGVLASSTTGVVNVTTKLDFTKFSSFQFMCGDHLLEVTLEQEKKEEKTILYYGLGSIGISLLGLSTYQANTDYLHQLKFEFNKSHLNCKFGNDFA